VQTRRRRDVPLRYNSAVTMMPARAEIDLYVNPNPPLLVVLSGPSGVGKDTLLNALKIRGYDFAFVVTMNSRPRRSNETNGVDYIFVTRDEFEAEIKRGELLEHSIVYGDYKGIPKAQVRRAIASGKDVVMRIDVQGAAKVRKMVPNAVMIFIAPESEAELVRRLQERDTESEEALRTRINTARGEMKRRDEFDYIIINRDDQQNEAVEQILAVIKAEHCRIGRTAPEI
jgi:guanylate kinase